jgi:predicted nucleic acid-binding protein
VPETRSLFDAFYAGRVSLLTPPIAYYEVANSIVKAVRQRRLAQNAGRVALEGLFDLALELAGDEDAELALRAAYPVAEQLNRSIYDGIFLVVSRAIGAPFVTADKPTWEAAGSTFDVVYLPNLRLP